MEKKNGVLTRLFKTVLGCFVRRSYRAEDVSVAIQDLCRYMGIDIQDNDSVLLRNVINVREMTVEDVMIPRADIVFVRADREHKQLLDFLCEMPHSRYPLYSEEKDKVIGTIHVKDVFGAYFQDPARFDLEKIKRPAVFVSPGMPVLDLLLRMRIQRVHMALVVDEYGGIDGIVTIEDMLEEIVGDIHDEHDALLEPQAIKKEDGIYIIDGRYTFDDLENLLGRSLRHEDNEEIDTIGGFVFHLAGHVPKKGEEVIDGETGLKFKVLMSDRRRIHKVELYVNDIMQENAYQGEVGT